MMLSILVFSFFLQIFSLLLTLRLIVLTRRYWIWGLFSAAVLLQAARRGLLLFALPDGEIQASSFFPSELIGLLISLFIFLGMIYLSFRLPILENASRALAASEEKYKKLSNEFQILLDGIPDLLILMSPDLKVIWANNAAGKTFGRNPRDLSGESCFTFWHNRSKPCDPCIVKNCFQSGKTENMKLETSDGKTWGVKAFPVTDPQGNVINVIEMVSDITEQIKLREQATRSNRLASLGELAAGVAHEINNPNAVILLNGSMLGDAFIEALPILDEYFRKEGEFWLGGIKYSEFREALPQLNSGVRDCAKRIKNIVQDLKNFARPDFIIKEKVDLNEVVQAAERLVHNVIKNSTYNFSSTYGNNLPPVKGSFQHLEQVAINLIINACQSLREKDKKIFVSTYHDKAEAKVVLEVRDEGIGISKENLPHVTDPFFTTKRDSGGTGLGLSVSSRIIEDHEGTLDFISTPGAGTTVTVSLPICQEY